MQKTNVADLKKTDPGAVRRHRWILPAIVFALSVVVTVMLVEGVRRQGSLAALDPLITAGVLELRVPWLTSIAQVFTFMGTALFLGPLAVVIVVTLLVKKRYRVGLLAALTMAMGLALTSLLKNLIGRDRPPVADQIGDFLGSYAFPSGHTLNTTVVIGVAILLVAGSFPRWRILLGAGWLAQVVLVGISRIYLGYHWLTDVLGGFAIGLAVLAAGYVASLFLVHDDERNSGHEAPRPAPKDLTSRRG